MAAKASNETPLMKQFLAIKSRYPGALLLFRVGDFYETFGEDAITASKVLDIVLTKRANGAASHVELAGFPHHALDSYLPKLVRAGHRVAICDQLEDPRMVKGIVKRGVTELVTPGLSFNDNVLEKRHNNYLASIHIEENNAGVAFLDLSTGEFLTAQGGLDYLDKLLQSFQPSEVLYSRSLRKTLAPQLDEKFNTYCLDEWIYAYDFAYEKLTGHFKTANLKGFGIEALQLGIVAAGAIMHYLEETEHHEKAHIGNISRIEEERYVWLDKFTIRNLELLRPQQDGGVPLVDILDKTVTPMGSRLMKKWIVLPLKDSEMIKERQVIVKHLVEDEALNKKFLDALKQIGDLERLISKVAVQRINPREMIHLKNALKNSLPVKEMLLKSGVEQFKKLGDQIHSCEFLLEKIEKELKEEVPIHSNQGGLIQDGIHEELDALRKIAYSGKDYLVQIQQREVKNTGITSLKVAYNKVFGYYLEVSNAHKTKVPTEWIRKQTLVNAERYITEELKEYEEKILTAEDKLVVIEQRLFQEIVTYAGDYVVQVQENARVLAKLDCLVSFAGVALSNGYGCPEVHDRTDIVIKDGRHPVIEQQLPPGETYVPNDVELNNQEQQIMIITGPNMAGKSALLRQTALIVLMAQMGSFVPASTAAIGMVDKVFTRVGASDNLSRGESTFMVEMTETASILNNLSDRSLLLMDEIGRGTSTYDGVSIAWAIVEYLHNHPQYRGKTLFATHYHELNQLTNDLERVRNFNVSVKESGEKILFLRKLKPGGSEHSFGIHVAQLAGMPRQVVLRAHEIMRFLEGKKERKLSPKDAPKQFQLSLFEEDPAVKEILAQIEDLDINTLSPVEALLKLNELKGVVKSRNKK